jgi:phage head maturation protease
MDKVKYLFNHDKDKNIGAVIGTELSDKGLLVLVELNKDMPLKDIFTYIKYLTDNGMFISFDSDDYLLKYKIGQYD